MAAACPLHARRPSAVIRPTIVVRPYRYNSARDRDGLTCSNTLFDPVQTLPTALRIVIKMAKKFKYDIYSLIENVESNECLWDKTSDASKDKIMRRNAWRDICLSLEPDFKDMDQETQDEITSSVMSKWANIRDTFIKSLKNKPGQVPKKKYVYSDNLQFLLKTVTSDETDSSVPTQNDNENRPESSQSSIPSPSKSSKITTRTEPKRLNTIDVEISSAIQAPPAGSELMDDDLAFMISLLPTLKQLDDDDKFEFRIEVMQLLRRFHNRRLSTSSDVSADHLHPKKIRR